MLTAVNLLKHEWISRRLTGVHVCCGEMDWYNKCMPSYDTATCANPACAVVFRGLRQRDPQGKIVPPKFCSHACYTESGGGKRDWGEKYKVTNHKSGKGCKQCIRGLLCDFCNSRFLSWVESHPPLRARFEDYLARRPFG